MLTACCVGASVADGWTSPWLTAVGTILLQRWGGEGTGDAAADCTGERAAMFGASGGDVMQDVTNSMLHVRVCVPTMIPVIPPAFVRAICAVCEYGPLLLREDKPDMSKPQPFVKGGTGHRYAMNRSDNFTIANVIDTIVALIA